MAAQMELGIFLAGNRMAQPGLVKQDKRELCKKEASRAYSYFEKGCRKKCARDNPER